MGFIFKNLPVSCKGTKSGRFFKIKGCTTKNDLVTRKPLRVPDMSFVICDDDDQDIRSNYKTLSRR